MSRMKQLLENRAADHFAQERWNRVSNLPNRLSSSSGELKPVRERLQPSEFLD
jgi:hypothetical protein